MKKILVSMLTLIFIFTVCANTVFAASKDQNNPTQLKIGTPYLSNIHTGGPEYYTFTLTEKSDVSIFAGRLPIAHQYTMNLWGNQTDGDGIDPITTSYIDEDALEINAILQPGTYYIDISGEYSSTPEEAFYNVLVAAVPEP